MEAIGIICGVTLFVSLMCMLIYWIESDRKTMIRVTAICSTLAVVSAFTLFTNFNVEKLSDLELEYIGYYQVQDNPAGTSEHKQFIIVEGEHVFFQQQEEEGFHVYYMKYHTPWFCFNTEYARKEMSEYHNFPYTGQGYIRVTERDEYWESKSKVKEEN